MAVLVQTLSKRQQAWLALSTLTSISPLKWLTLLSSLRLSPDELIRQSQDANHPDINNDVKAVIKSIDRVRIAQCLDWMSASEQHHIITFDDACYPNTLKQLSSPPLAIYINGNPTLLNASLVAIVGSRHASQGGLALAKQFANQLSAQGIGIVSGLAAGIDAAAHWGAHREVGRTLAVIGSGNDIIYPKRNNRLHEALIKEGGAVMSEFWPGTPPKAAHFPRRNRIIAGLACATLVIEAKIKSGTLITANLAADLGKEVMAVPGHIYNPAHEGCHHLIQQGAALITSLSDVIESLPFQVQNQVNHNVQLIQKSHGQSLASEPLLDSVDYDVTAIDVIAERNGLPISDVMARLLQYELRGLVSAVPGGYVKLRGK